MGKMPTEVFNKLKGYSIVSKEFNFKINEEELGEYAPSVTVKSLTIKQQKNLEKLIKSDETSDDELTKAIKPTVVEIDNIYDLSTLEKVDTSDVNKIWTEIPLKIKIKIVEEVLAISGLM